MWSLLENCQTRDIKEGEETWIQHYLLLEQKEQQFTAIKAETMSMEANFGAISLSLCFENRFLTEPRIVPSTR